MKKAREDLKITREKLCAILNELEPDMNELRSDTLKQWELGVNQINIAWIPAICKALNCDTGYLFGEHEEKAYLECDIHEKTGLSENSILSLRAIMEMESPIKEAVSYFLDDLLDGLHILTLSVRYKEYRENTHSESDSYYVTDSTGKPIDMIDDNISILLLQNEFNRFIFEENDPEKRFFSRSSLRKEYASLTVEERLDHLLEHQSDLERGK